MIARRLVVFAAAGFAAAVGAVIGAVVAWASGADPLHGIAIGGGALGVAGAAFGWRL